MNIQNIALKAKNTIVNNTVGRVITTAHRKGDLSATSDSFVIRGISKNGKEGVPKGMEHRYQDVLAIMEKTDKEFKKLIPNIFPKKFYRGTMGNNNECAQILRKAKIGDVVVPDNGYSFITKSKDTALGYATRCDGKGDETIVFMEILLPSGSKISKNPFHLREAVMPRCAKYEVAGKKEENGILRVILRYLPEK